MTSVKSDEKETIPAKTQTSQVDVEILVNKLENLITDVPLPKESQTKTETGAKANYFSKKVPAKTSASAKKPPIYDEAKLRDVKAKIVANMDKNRKYTQAKEIPLDESYLILKEHQQRVHDFQIQQATEKLLQGQQTIKFDYSFFHSQTDEGKHQ